MIREQIQKSTKTSAVNPAPSVAPEVAAPEPTIEETSEVLIAAEPTEESSNWWLWLIGAVVVVGGILVIRSKK